MSSSEKVFSPKNIFELFLNSAEKYHKKEALRYKTGHYYEHLRYEDLKNEVISLAVSLRKMGLKKGDRVILFSENRPEWVICDLAFAAIGVVNVPVHVVLSVPQFVDIINEIEPKVLFFSGNSSLEKILEAYKLINRIPCTISYEKISSERISNLIFFKELISHKPSKKEELSVIEHSGEVGPTDLISITYTSGSTGHPKGVKLTHGNIIENIKSIMDSYQDDIKPEDRLFSVLPLSHIFERTAGYYVPFCYGASISYCIDLTDFSNEIKDIRPTIILAVPRLFEKMYDQILMKAEANILSKILFRYAIYVRTKNRNRVLVDAFDKLVFSKIRKNLGGEIRFFVSGGAPLSQELAEFFEKVGLIILEGYGLTETSPVIASTRLRDYRFGTVGPVVSGVDISFGRNSEIFVKGPNVFSGYINEDDNKTCFVDGWFRTGDLGHLDRGGCLVITGRRKEMIVLSTGKKVIPTTVEDALEDSVYIEQAFVWGEGKKHICALIVPNFEALSSKFKKPTHELVGNKAVNSLVALEVKERTKDLASYEKVNKFEVISNPFTIDNGELTPTMKLRRHVIYKRYSDLIEEMY